MKKRNVQYERCLIVYIDILGFKQKIDTESPNHISRCIRVIAEAVEPHRFKSTFPKLPRENFVNFSDLCVLWFSLEDDKKLPLVGWLTSQILKIVQAQSWLLFDEELLIRGGVTIGPLAKSYGQIFGPASSGRMNWKASRRSTREFSSTSACSKSFIVILVCA